MYFLSLSLSLSSQKEDKKIHGTYILSEWDISVWGLIMCTKRGRVTIHQITVQKPVYYQKKLCFGTAVEGVFGSLLWI